MKTFIFLAQTFAVTFLLVSFIFTLVHIDKKINTREYKECMEQLIDTDWCYKTFRPVIK